MRHQLSGRKLGRKTEHRKAMFRNLATSLIEHERIETSLNRARELRPIAERLVTLGKGGTLASRRRALSFVRSRTAVKKLFDELAPRFAARHGGYTRMYKLGFRYGDASPMALIEFVDRPTIEKKSPEKKVAKKNK